MTNYTILLPPSEGKTKGGNEEFPYRRAENLKEYNSFKSLTFDRQELYNTLREAINKLSEQELEKVLEVKGKNLNESVSQLLDMLNSPTMAAIERFSGVMFKSISYDSMGDGQKLNFNSSTLFIDGMFGLARPQDLLPEYKLKITSKFLDINVTKFWKERLKGDFDILFKDRLIIDILPEAHRKVLTLQDNADYVQITFMDEKEDGSLKQAGHNSKVLKGEIVNYICGFEDISRENLETFSHSSGYFYSEELSNSKRIVYLKKD